MTFPTYLILGATGGMGQALCERLSKRGASLLIGGRDPVRLEELSQRTGAESLAGDARDPLAIDRAVACTVERFGRIDGAVNLVGSLLLKPAHENDAAATVHGDQMVDQFASSGFVFNCGKRDLQAGRWGAMD